MMSENCLIIGFSGKAGSGKDTCAEFTKKHDKLWNKQWDISSFAYPIKAVVEIIFGISFIEQNDRLTKEIIHPDIGKSPRELAQFIGTEVGRNVISPWLGLDKYSLWIKSLEYQTDPDTVVMLIPDVRFQDEADWILDRGPHNIIINLTRPGADGAVGISNHSSEAGFIPKDRSRYHEILNDSFDPQILRSKLYAVLDSCIFP